MPTLGAPSSLGAADFMTKPVGWPTCLVAKLKQIIEREADAAAA